MIENFVLVVKPGIVFGNLVSAAGGFFLASRGQIDSTLLLGTLTGISLVVSSACVFNNCTDRRMDRRMARTRDRVLARGVMGPKSAALYGLFLGIAGAALLLRTTNMLTAAVTAVGFAVYVLLYGPYLKRNSMYGALIGSLAGAAPPLAGYCAAGNKFDLGAAVLFSTFCFWQIPHFHAIALFRIEDYAAAAIPTLPGMKGRAAARRHIIGSVLALTISALMLTFAGYTGYRYLAVSALMGLCWLCMAWSGRKVSDDRLWARRLFIFSILYIFVLSFMMSIDFTAPASGIRLVCAP